MQSPSTPSQIASLLEKFSLGKLQYIRLLSKGIATKTYVVSSSKDLYILSVFDEDKTDLPLILKGSQYLINQGFPFAKILAFGKISKKRVLITSRLPGKVQPYWDVEEYRAVGFFLGNFHKCAEGFFIKDTTAKPLISKIFSDYLLIQKEIPKEFYRLENDLLSLKDTWPMHLPQGLVHGDIWHKNIFFLEKNISGIFDFYPTYDSFLVDIANIIKRIFLSTTSQKERFYPEFLSAYQLARPLKKEEIEALHLFVYAKILSTILYLLKKSLLYPNRKDQLQTFAFCNLLKLDQEISFAKITDFAYN